MEELRRSHGKAVGGEVVPRGERSSSPLFTTTAASPQAALERVCGGSSHIHTTYYCWNLIIKI